MGGLLVFVLQEAHVNACYKHFYFFVIEFKLMDSKEFEPLVSSYHGDHDYYVIVFTATPNSQIVLLIRNHLVE